MSVRKAISVPRWTLERCWAKLVVARAARMMALVCILVRGFGVAKVIGLEVVVVVMLESKLLVVMMLN